MTTKIAALIFLGSVMLIRADQLVERVQQALKDQGFYYGEVTGEMNPQPSPLTKSAMACGLGGSLWRSRFSRWESPLPPLGHGEETLRRPALLRPPDQAKDLPTKPRIRRLRHRFKRSATRRKANK